MTRLVKGSCQFTYKSFIGVETLPQIDGIIMLLCMQDVIYYELLIKNTRKVIQMSDCENFCLIIIIV